MEQLNSPITATKPWDCNKKGHCREKPSPNREDEPSDDTPSPNREDEPSDETPSPNREDEPSDETPSSKSGPHCER